jgi:hypothetical protein
MGTADLPAEIWIVIGLIAGLAVTLCLAVLASLHGHLVKVRRLGEEVKALRDAYNAAFRTVEFVDGPPAAPPGGAEASGEPDRKAA